MDFIQNFPFHKWVSSVIDSWTWLDSVSEFVLILDSNLNVFILPKQKLILGSISQFWFPKKVTTLQRRFRKEIQFELIVSFWLWLVSESKWFRWVLNRIWKLKYKKSSKRLFRIFIRLLEWFVMKGISTLVILFFMVWKNVVKSCSTPSPCKKYYIPE